MRSLGLDVGDVRIGVAVSDPTGTVVEPLTTIRTGTRAAAIEKIAELVEQECVGEVVVGTPVSLDGEVGPQARKIRAFTDLLAERISKPVRMWDESYSSLTADRIMGESGVGRRKKKGKRDSVAAAVILREYLQGTRSTVAPQPVDSL